MNTSLSRKLGLVALTLVTFSACQTAKTTTGDEENYTMNPAWFNPYYGADRRPAGDPIQILSALVKDMSPAEKKSYFEFLAESKDAALAEYRKVYQSAVRSGRQQSEETLTKLEGMLKKVDGEAQDRIFANHVGDEERFLNRVRGNPELFAKAVTIAKAESETMTKSANVKRFIELMKTIPEGSAAQAGATAAARALPDLPELFKSLMKMKDAAGNRIHDSKEVRELLDLAVSIFNRTGYRTLAEDGKTVIMKGGVSIVSVEGCLSNDREGLQTLLRQARETDTRLARLEKNAPGCLHSLNALRQSNAIVIMEDNVANLGRGWAAAADVVEAYPTCGNGIVGVDEAVRKPAMVDAIKKAEKQGLKQFPNVPLDCK